MSEYIKNLKAPLAIIGMGKSGAASYELLLAAGRSPEEVITFDAKQSDAQFNDPHHLIRTMKPQTLIVSPGVPLSLDWIQNAKTQGVHITSEINLAASVFKNEKVIGVTGSVGKSTTVSILGAGLSAFSQDGFVGGNLGIPLAEYACGVLNGGRPRADWIILELSSYQLENCEQLHLDFSAITYLTANHLERYADLQDYYRTKWHITEITAQDVVLNPHGGDLSEFAHRHQTKKLVWAQKNSAVLQSFHLSQAQLIGSHNQDNLAMAATIALAAGWPPASIEAMKGFSGLAHRLENLGEKKGIRFINDSKATAMDSVLIACQAAAEKHSVTGKVYVLLGGRDKNLPWEQLHALASVSCLRFVFFGETRAVAQAKSQLPGPSFAHLYQAIEHCLGTAVKGDTVLLSPGGTSLDEFKNFEERGDFFRKKVQLFADT